MDVKRTAPVVAKTVCILVVLTSDEIHEKLSLYPDIKDHLNQLAELRFKELVNELEKAGRELHPDLSEKFCSLQRVTTFISNLT